MTSLESKPAEDFAFSSSPFEADGAESSWQEEEPASQDGAQNEGLATPAPKPLRRVRFQESPRPRGSDVLFCPTLREHLQPRPSTFKPHNYYGGGFVSDGDRVIIASLVHSADSSSRVSDHRDSHENLEALERLAATPSFRRGMAAQRRALAQWRFRDGSPLGTLSEEDSEGSEGEGGSMSSRMEMPRYALRAGPRDTIYFNPPQTRIAIVTVGGLCPGLNDVIRSLVSKASDYGVPEGNILGMRFGFRGFARHQSFPPVPLTRANTDDIHLEGGTVLGTSDAVADVLQIVKCLDLWSIDMLFIVGGIQSQSVAAELRRECARHSVLTSVVAIPKSIDNDFLLIDKTFGFHTAVEEAQKPLLAARTEASSAYRGIGIVQLLGKKSGFIAVKASLASGVVDVCLIPEVPFSVDALAEYLEGVLDARGNAVVCIAEGAAQDQVPDETPDSTASPELKDVGHWLKGELKSRLKDVDIKLIQPGNLVRSVPASSNDRIYCKLLAHSAVHAAFAGYTGVLVGLCNTHYVILPLISGAQARRVDPEGALWSRLRATTGQPTF